MAEHLDGVSHDAVSDYLQRERLTARQVWEWVKPLLNDSEQAYLIVDDSVQNKQYARKIELVKKQYSGAEHGLVRGIGVVNLVHTDGQDFYPVDYRIYAPEADGKTKNDHFREMLLHAKSDKHLQARTLLFDSWYASVANLKLIVRLDMFFVTTLKDNRLVSLSKEQGYLHLQDIEWVITNHPQGSFSPQAVQDENALRWQIEQLHRELKQLTGSEKCECRKARSQRTHLACCYLSWLSLKVKALELDKTLYKIQHDLFSDYLRAELRHPRIPALAGL